MKVSVVIPTLNEEEGIGKTIDMIKVEEFKRRGWDLEIIVVDGESKDRTREIARSKGAKVIIEPRKGYGRAYKTGLKEAKGEIIVTGDADATYPFDKIHEYIDYLLKNDLDFITTNRFAGLKKGAMSVKHVFGNLILSLTLRLLFMIKLRDSQSGMWIFRRDSLKKIQPLEKFDDGMPFSEEIKIEMFRKVRAEEIPSALYIRKGKAKLQSFSDGWKNFKFLIKKRLSC
ncbi:MAG: glycosyltransferase family 2 protein [Thermoplasmata archaeon]|nr:glycosyltransferase family 2 protein [Thermoplasmata archaeon]